MPDTCPAASFHRASQRMPRSNFILCFVYHIEIALEDENVCQLTDDVPGSSDDIWLYLPRHVPRLALSPSAFLPEYTII